MKKESLLHLAETVGAKLKERSFYLAAAESCTGGGISYWLTAIPGSSNWFDRGFITYSNNAKEQMLGVNPQTLQQHGAVSQAVAIEMAQGALKNSQAQISLATTGIAGPTGGTPKNPVGTVWIAWASIYFPAISEKHVFTGTREDVREKSIAIALEKLLTVLV